MGNLENMGIIVFIAATRDLGCFHFVSIFAARSMTNCAVGSLFLSFLTLSALTWPHPDEVVMEKRTLGRTNLAVSCINANQLLDARIESPGEYWNTRAGLAWN
jgi:hypothetical protein